MTRGNHMKPIKLSFSSWLGAVSLLSVMGPSAWAQTRSTPGAGTLASTAPGAATGDARPVQIGDYVELDPSVRNEMYGTIDFPNAELKDIVKAISKLASKNFILDRKIENRRITIISPEAVTKQEAYNA